MEKINISGFNHTSIVDGPGIRFTVYTQGCNHKCFGCHNQDTWSTLENKLYTVEQIIDLIKKDALTRNVTISGGEPLLQIDQICLLTKRLKQLNYNIWLYSGYTLSQIKSSEKLSQILKTIDVLVDGKYDDTKRDISDKYRGSYNQDIIYLNEQENNFNSNNS